MKLLTNPNGGDGEKRPGVMIPIPQYPLYSASLAEYNMHQIGYYLNEDKNWSLDMSEIERAYNAAEAECAPRAIVVINPGNPTGNVLSRANIEAVVKFAAERKLFVFADEVYQDNVYADGCKFHSFKKVQILFLKFSNKIKVCFETSVFMLITEFLVSFIKSGISSL